jgi:hypothetical protein
LDRIHRNIGIAQFSLALLLVGAGCDISIDISKLKPDATQLFGCTEGTDEEGEGTCRPEVAQVKTCRDLRGQWTLVLPVGETVKHTTITVETNDAVAADAIDWNDGSGAVAGFVVSFPTSASRDAVEWADILATRIRSSNAWNTVKVRSTGYKATSWDGHDLVVGTELEVSTGDPKIQAELSHDVRNRVYSLLLDLSPEQIKGGPRLPNKQSSTFRLSFATLVRSVSKRVIVTGGVATLENFNSSLNQAHIRLDGLADASFVGGLDATTRARCETRSFKTPYRQAAQVDLLWLVDGSDHGKGTEYAMYDLRNRFHGAAPSAWDRAKALGIDLRQAVAGMDQQISGELCGAVPPDKGRFWSQDGLGSFQPCLLWPSKVPPPPPPPKVPEPLRSRGLASALKVLLGLLPRATDNPRLLRKDAQTALLFLTNQEDYDVLTHFSAKVPDPFTAVDRKKLLELPRYLELVNYLRKEPDAGLGLAGTIPFALVTDSSAGCGKGTVAGYEGLIAELDGHRDPICQDDGGAKDRLHRVLDDLAAGMSAISLKGSPVTSTIKIHLNNKREFPSHAQGFAMHRRAMLLYGLTNRLKATNTLEVSYIGF